MINDIFGPGSNVTKRVISNYDEIAEKVEACRKLGFRIILTSGTFDIYHEGHARYLEKAKSEGDILIVGIDNDDKVRRRKEANRPMVAEGSRMEILCHCRHVDLVFLKKDGDPKWGLIKAIRPDVLIATQRTYSEDQIKEHAEFCGEVKVLEPQAATSTTAIIRNVLVGMAKGTVEEAEEKLKSAVEEIIGVLGKLKVGGH